MAAAVVRGPYQAINCSGLPAIIDYSTLDEGIVSRLAHRMLKRMSLYQGGVRHIVAAARLAYDRDPISFAAKTPPRSPAAGSRAFPWSAYAPRAVPARRPSQSVRSGTNWQAVPCRN